MRYEQPSKGLFIINPILLCKTFCNKTSFVALNGTIRASLNLVVGLSAKIVAKGRKLVLILHLEAKYAKIDCKNEIYAKN